MSSDKSRSNAFKEDLKKALESNEYKAEILEESKKTVARLKAHAAQYLSDEGQKILEVKAQRLMNATAKLETLTDSEDIKHQKRVVATISRMYELRFNAIQVAKEIAVIKARDEVLSLLKKAGQDFAVIAAKTALRHGVSVLKESL